MKKIVLIRHGKAAMAGKDHERELDEDGIIQAKSLKNKLIEIDLKNAINVSYILGSLLPLTPLEKQTMLEFENSKEKLDYLKSIIKKLGG